jgi:carboxypeptidase Q
VLAIECDMGVTRPTGLGLGKAASQTSRDRVHEIGRLLSGIGADRIDPDGGGADIGPLAKLGVITASLNVDASRYFDIHHTEADTFDKIDRTELNRCVGAMAVYSYLIADLQERLK